MCIYVSQTHTHKSLYRFVDDFSVDSSKIVPFAMSCAGFEERLEECQLAAVDCNYLRMEGADAIAVRCNDTVSCVPI